MSNSKAKEQLQQKLQKKEVREQLGLINDELYEEKKQTKYLYSINSEVKRVSLAFNEDTSVDGEGENSQQQQRYSNFTYTSKVQNNEHQEQNMDDVYSDEYSSGSDDDDTESVLSEISDELVYFEKKILFQRRALFRKNITLQWRQKCTNLCQLVTPVLGLFIVLIFKEVGMANLVRFSDKVIDIPAPQIFDINYKGLSQVLNGLKVTSCDQWYIYEFQPYVNDTEREFFGFNEGNIVNKSFDAYGMIKPGEMSFYCNQNDKMTPYFIEFTKERYDDKYDSMEKYISETLNYINEQYMEVKDKDFQVEGLDRLPDGAYQIRQANSKTLNYNMQVSDHRFWQYHRNNGITKIGFFDAVLNETTYMVRTIEGGINVADTMNKAYIRTLFNDTTIVSGVNFYPFQPSFEMHIQRGVSAISGIIIPICMCMALPVFIYQIVLEKETRLVETMKINGMRMSNYWIVNFIFDLCFYSLTAVIFMISGAKLFKMQIFLETSFPLLVLVLFGWGLAQISQAFLVSVFLNKAQTATIVGYTLSIWFTTVAVAFNLTLYCPPNTMDWFLFPIPTFTFARLIHHIAYQCGYKSCVANLMDMNSEMVACLIFLYLAFVVYLALAMYLYQVVPQTYGVPKKWNYLCKRRPKNKQRRNTDEIGDLEHEREQQERPVFDFDLSLEDADSKAERNMVYNLDKADYYKYPLIIKDLRKVYPGFGGRPPKAATKSMCLRIKKGEMFGLLGPNGAGKTTLISILTGLYQGNSGNAWVAGYDIKNQLEIVQLQIGVCPQFDVLWNDLTVEEHLLFYARLKGISPDREYDLVEKAIAEVLLEKFRYFKVKSLSGGMKRRVSVAISLVSEPKIIYLDEPSTGLDPENRRQLWDILSAQKGKRAIILTTHSMEEADVLCNRIGIVNDGILRCVGPQVRLKSIYGGGYHLFVNCQKGKVLSLLKQLKKKKKKEQLKEKVAKHSAAYSIYEESKNDESGGEEDEVLDQSEINKRVEDFIKQMQPSAIMIREFNGNFVYQIPLEGFDAEYLFLQMEKNKQRLKISDWGISQCSLEDVFSRICEPK